MSYTPRPFPKNPELQRELQKVRESFKVVHQHDVLHVEPEKKEGLQVYADGTDWNPGGGKGMYYYNGSAWVFMG